MPTTDAVVSPRDEALTDDQPTHRGDLSIFLATPATADPYQTYVDALESIELAEHLGYSHAWIAEAHFSSNFGIPTALALAWVRPSSRWPSTSRYAWPRTRRW